MRYNFSQAIDFKLNGEQSIQSQIARLEKEEHDWKKEQARIRREEKQRRKDEAAAVHVEDDPKADHNDGSGKNDEVPKPEQ